MELDPIATAFADVIFQLALCRVEAVPDRDVDIFVSAVLLVFPPGHDFQSRNSDVDLHAVDAPLMAVPVRSLYQDRTRRYPIMEAGQPANPFANYLFYRS
jgi:hypothetical protein